MTAPILLLRGAPGAGKSTVAGLLRDVHGLAIVEVDDVRGELWHVPPLAGFSDAARHHVALATAAVMALALRKTGLTVAVVDTFNNAGHAAFVTALRGRAATLTIALVLDPAELARRLATRPEAPGVFRDVEVSTRLNEELRTGAGERVDVTRSTPADVAAHIMTLAGCANSG